MSDTASVTFSLEELWLMRSVVRHELQGQEMWKFPPASLALNDAIAEAILFCDENKVNEAALILSRGDCLVLDHNIPQDAKSASGVLLGKAVLLKSFRARAEIAGRFSATSENPDEPVQLADLGEKVEKWKQQRQRRRRKAS